MTSLVVPADVIRQTFDQLRECGGERHECVVYWCAAVESPDRVIDVVHPRHTASRVGYEVDSAWVNDFFLDLRQSKRTVRVQVHTHPGLASHSGVDDEFALAPATGFVSLVVPDFAVGAPGLERTHLVVMQADGAWEPRPAADVLNVER